MTLGEFFTALGYVVGALVFWWAARRRRLATDGIGKVVVTGFVCGILGAKVTELIAEGWPIRLPWIAALDLENGGRALLGGVIFGWLGVVLAKHRLGIRRPTGDLFALALPAGEAIGRVGCYFNQCCYGIKCNLPWAIYQHGALRHPTQIYSSLTGLGLLLWLLWEARRRGMFGLGARDGPEPEGDLFYLYLLGFGITRFLIEFVRWRESLFFGLSPMQWFCLDLIVVGAVGLRLVALRRSGTPTAPMLNGEARA
jgi:phosphatidylglycerol---prolipoprotein diacylglyceryl transferase